VGIFKVMPLFFHKTEPKTIRAYSLEDCPNPSEWTDKQPDYSKKETQPVSVVEIVENLEEV
jgi:hypothetical protein